MNKLYFELNSEDNLPIKCDLYYQNGENKPLTIISHGFKSFRNWGFNPYLSKAIAKNIGPVLCFDYSMNGIDNDQKMLYKDDIFRKNTVGVELSDLSIIINSLNSISILNDIWNGEVNIIGHSMGGAIAVLVAKENHLVKKLSLWGTISKWDRNTKRQKEDWKEKGYVTFTENSTGQTLHLDYSYLEYKEVNKDKIDIRKALSSLKIPIQIIHGEQDFTVPAKEGEILFSKSNHPESEIKIIPKTGHTFGIKHPMKETNPGLEEAINQTIKFLA